jgi:hypothetical protein
MASIVLKLDPARLTNRDLDIRYVLPDLLAEGSDGLLEDGGYDYEEGSNRLLIYLDTTDLEKAVPYVSNFLSTTIVMGNDLRDGAEMEIED